jgi:Peptidase S24-like
MSEAADGLPDCAGGESFALRVLGHSMAPEFNEGEIIIIEPEGLARATCSPGTTRPGSFGSFCATRTGGGCTH